jgi:hypothetical protein
MVVVGFMIVDYPRSGITAAPSRAPIRVATWSLTRVNASLRPAQMFCLIGGRDPVTIARPVG